MKVNRVACKKHYCEALTNLYEHLDDPATMRQTVLSMLGANAVTSLPYL